MRSVKKEGGREKYAAAPRKLIPGGLALPVRKSVHLP